MVKIIVRLKRISLLCQIVKCVIKKFYNISPWSALSMTVQPRMPKTKQKHFKIEDQYKT